MEITLTWALFWKIMLAIAGYYDGEKYLTQANKILRKKSSGSVSRFFSVKAWLLDVVLLGYVIFNYSNDTMLLITRIFPIFTIGYLYYLTYLYYPYKRRGLNGWKRPSLIEFIVDSFRPKGKL